jgi:K+-sensing histidine kinase KdpD
MSESTVSPNIPWCDVVKFVRQLNHDLRNHLNSFELQTAYIAELVDDPEVKDEVKRLRATGSELGEHLQRLSAAIAQINLHTMPYKAADFFEDLRTRIKTDDVDKATAVEWKIDLADEMLEIDPQLLVQAFRELFTNAFIHGRGEGPLSVNVHAADTEVEFVLGEPKSEFKQSTENWGVQPLCHVAQDHYGLGLFQARAILEAHHGRMFTRYDSEASVLATTVALPSLKQAH